jgi:serine/threonine protein kinase
LAINCPKCGHSFVPAGAGAQPCPACGHVIDLSAATDATILNANAEDDYVPFGDKTELLASDEPSGNEPTIAASTPPPAERRSGVRRTSPSKEAIPVAAPAPASEVDMTVPVSRPPVTGPPAAAAASSVNKSSTFAGSSPDNVDLIGRTLDGFKVTKKLGAGGMGAVMLARQVSLDRDVALKVLPGKFASNPDFLARFTREALSAAQLTHHNVIQVYEVGCSENVHYIAMELVRGKSLGDLTRTDGKLSIEDSASYVLQTARGLLYAHERGIIHRDIKPDNIMINEHGIVKIADMGLAKMTGTIEPGVGLDHNEDAIRNAAYSNLTDAEVAMGTPSYMAPEQGRDASKVDHRADQYSLGCTLYYLVAGKTPFTGKTTFEILSKHASEPLVPIETVVKNVPKELSYIIEKMLAKTPEERYGSLKEVIDALEGYLGLESSKGPYSPREHHVGMLERSLTAYNGAPQRKLRMYAKLGFFGGTAGLFLLLAVMGLAFPASAVLGLLVLTPLFHFLLDGVLSKTFLFRRTRAVFFGMSLKNWGVVLLSTIAILVTLYFFNLLMPWLAVSIFAAGFAAAYQFLVLKPLRAARQKPIDEVNDVLKQLRIRGVSEDALRDFIYRFSDAHWEEFFEELFGYEDMVLWRGKFARQDKAKPRKKYGTWRDPMFRWLDEVEESRKRDREKKQLARAEKERLKSKGMDEAAATAEAEKLATEAVDEGLIKTAILPAGPTKKEIEQIDRELHRSAKRSNKSGLWGWGFWLARLVVALVAIVGCGAPFLASVGLSLPVPNVLGMLGLTPPASLPLLIAGTLVAVSLFSRQFLFPLLLTAGTVLAMGAVRIPALIGNPQFTPGVAAWGGLLLAVVSFVFMMIAMMKKR